jgi:lipocalin
MFSTFFFLTFFVVIYGNDYKAVDEIDLTKYMGKWYQVYGDKFNRIFQGNGRCSTAEYGLIDDGRVSVLNKQFDENNKLDAIPGYAYYSEGDCCGYLTVELEGTKPAPYWVLELGPIVSGNYEYSIVSDNLALSLFVLARDVDTFYKLYDTNVLESLKEFGFTKPWNLPTFMNQTDCELIGV